MCVWLKPLCLHRIHIINYWFGHCSFRFVEYCGRFSRSYCDCFMLRAPTNQNKSRKQQERRATQRCMCTNRVDDNTHGGVVIEPKWMRQQKQMINWIKTNKQKKFRLWRATKARRARTHDNKRMQTNEMVTNFYVKIMFGLVKVELLWVFCWEDCWAVPTFQNQRVGASRFAMFWMRAAFLIPMFDVVVAVGVCVCADRNLFDH